MSGHQQTIYTIHESQLTGNSNNNNNNNESNGSSMNQQQRTSQDILIDTSSIPMTQLPMPPIQHQHLSPSQQQQLEASSNSSAITNQPGVSSSNNNNNSTGRIAPENQNVVYSVHPVFTMLDNFDALVIKQKADCTSTCCGFESVNTYTVRSKDGAPILKALEYSNCCERCCFESNREYSLTLVHGEEIVARIRKTYRLSRFCCYSNAVRIESPEDNPIGYIRQVFTFFGHPRYAIFDCQQSPKTPSFYIESTSCRFCCTPFLCTCICGNKEFRIVSVEPKEEVGTILRYWQQNQPIDQFDQQQSQQQQPELQQPKSDSNSEPDTTTFVNLDTSNGSGSGCGQLFGVEFSPNLEARQKVLLLSACFMMDFFYFENDRRRRKLASC